MTRKIAVLFLICALTLVPVLPMSLNVAADTPDYTGTGTEWDPYLIYTEAGLRSMPTLGTNNKHYKLMNDIVMSDDPWSGLVFTNGVFDGNGFGIYNITVASAQYMGFFSQVENSVIRNLLIDSADIPYVGNNAGGLVAISKNSTYEYIVTNNISFGTLKDAGGILYSSQGDSIYRCINRSDYYSTVLAEKGAGGIINKGINTTIRECVNYGNITHTRDSSGGIACVLTDGEISDCYSTGTIVGGNSAGGITSVQDNCVIRNSYVLGDISSSSSTSLSGGITGVSRGNKSIESCVSICSSVTGTNIGRITGTSNYQNLQKNLALATLLPTVTGAHDDYHGQSTLLADLLKQETYEALGWDFENVWIMSDTFPVLRFENGNLPEPPPDDTHTVTVITRYRDNAIPEHVETYYVPDGGRFEEHYEVLDGYGVYSSRLRTAFAWGVDEENQLVIIDPVDRAYTVEIEFYPITYNVVVQTQLSDSTPDDVRTYTLRHGEAFDEQFEVPAGYTYISFLSDNNEVYLIQFERRILIDNVTQNTRIVLTLKT